MYNLWDNGCESYVYKPCVAHGKGMVYMSPIVTPTIICSSETATSIELKFSGKISLRV